MKITWTSLALLCAPIFAQEYLEVPAEVVEDSEFVREVDLAVEDYEEGGALQELEQYMAFWTSSDKQMSFEA